MKYSFSDRIWNILSCPGCGGELSRIETGAKCLDCHQEYIYSKERQLDLRLHKNKMYQLNFEILSNVLPEKEFEFKILQKNAFPEVDFTNVSVPSHLTEELISYFPGARKNNSIVLDIGCGDTVHREVCEHAGFDYVGIDINSPDAPLLGDAQALPFKNNSVEFIISVAVLEHIRYPFIMMKEAYRVLQPGGKFIGTVAFLEPFHGDSYYHHSNLGTFNSLAFAGFDINHITPNKDWPVIVAQARMRLFPKLPSLISKSLVLPLHLLHRIWWKLGYLITHSDKIGEKYRILSTSGSFFFIATRGEDK